MRKSPGLPYQAIADLVSAPQELVDDGATYAGILRYRGQIMSDIHNGIAEADRDTKSLIALFAAGIEKDLSFTMEYVQTRGRLAYCVCERVEKALSKSTKADNPILTAYIFACIEYSKPALLGSIANESPTYYQRRFVETWKQNPRSLPKLSVSQNKNLGNVLAKHIESAKSSTQWEQVDKLTKDIIDFLYPNGPEHIAALAKKEWKSRGSRGKGKQEGAPARSSAKGRGFIQQPTYLYDDAPFKEYLTSNDNTLLRALLAPMPGLRTGTEIRIADGGLDDFEDLAAELPAVKGAKVEYAYDKIRKSEASPDESCALIAHAFDIKDIKERDEKRELWLAAGGGSDGMDVDDEEMDLSALRGEDEGDEMEE